MPSEVTTKPDIPTEEELEIIRQMGDGTHGHGDEPKRPEYYRVPLKSRDRIIDWLESNAHWDDRSYDHRTWLFCFDVKLNSLDLDFDHLLEVFRKGEASSPDHPLQSDPQYVEDCRQRHEERYGKSQDKLYEVAVEDAQSGVIETRKISGRWEMIPTDTYNTLWVDDSIDVRLSFEGRSSGWLVVNTFNGITLDRNLDLDDPDQVDYKTLRQLYEYITMMSHDFGDGKPEAEVEYQAAWHLFNRVCDDIPTDAVMVGSGI